MTPLEAKTIAAISTPQGYGGIGIIRVSGADALALTLKLLPHTPAASFAPNHTSLHRLIHPDTAATIDEALITYFKAPHSFTGEDVIEIACHGSPVVLAEVLRLLKSFGAEFAQPGEFSLRAFLNQRMDLAQAEAINDLIHAQTSHQARLAVRQLRGELSRQLQPLKQELTDLIVYFESSVEFVEDDLAALELARFQQRIGQLIATLERLTATFRLGRIIRSGIKLAIIGSPNVGKSSLFNALLGADRAIVTHIPGTTRDMLAESCQINGIPIHLMDTAGIRQTEDVIERIGVERSKTAIAEADFILGVCSLASPLSEDEKSLFTATPAHLYVLNKSDLGIEWPAADVEWLREHAPVVTLSAQTGAGLEALRQTIYQQLLDRTHAASLEDALITNERHFDALERTLTALRQSQDALAAGFTEEIALNGLHQALRALGEITGETLLADILNQIFSTFCIGK
jgi:tRNA modification GTPase